MPDDGNRIAQVIEMSAARSAASLAWQGRLQKNKDGAALPTVANALVFFANDPELKAMLGYNSFTSQHLIMRAPPLGDEGDAPLPGPYPRPWQAEDVALVLSYLQRIWCPKFNRQTIEDAMLATAAVCRFHPILQWIDGLRWDGVKRIDLWLISAFDCENTQYHRAVGAKFLIAAVRRLRQPGCKFDHMPVLEGGQGIGKSTAIRELFGEPWFSDSIPPDLNSRDAALALLGVWCLEFAEIEHLIRAEVETIKAFLSRAVDRYRPPYGKNYVERPRQGVLIGTTNSDDYLRDATGNRRIWPVKCRAASPSYLTVNRDQLWAEAAHREAAGEAIWFDDVAIRTSATTVQAERMSEDVWADPIADYLAMRLEATTAEILTHGLAVPRERQGKAQEMRVAAVMRQLGWERRVKWAGKTARVWMRPKPPPPDPTREATEW